MLSIVIILLFLSACSGTSGGTTASNEPIQPEEVRDEIWDASFQVYYKMIDDFYNLGDASESIDNLDGMYEYDAFVKIYKKYMETNEAVSSDEYSILSGNFELLKEFSYYMDALTDINTEGMNKHRDNFLEQEEKLRVYFPDYIEIDEELLNMAKEIYSEANECTEGYDQCNFEVLKEMHENYIKLHEDRKDTLNTKQKTHNSSLEKIIMYLNLINDNNDNSGYQDSLEKRLSSFKEEIE
jgi:hypothetical protein